VSELRAAHGQRDASSVYMNCRRHTGKVKQTAYVRAAGVTRENWSKQRVTELLALIGQTEASSVYQSCERHTGNVEQAVYARTAGATPAT